MTPPADLSRQVHAMVKAHGVNASSRMLGVGREVVARLAARLDVRAGSIALAEKNLASIADAWVEGA